MYYKTNSHAEVKHNFQFKVSKTHFDADESNNPTKSWLQLRTYFVVRDAGKKSVKQFIGQIVSSDGAKSKMEFMRTTGIGNSKFNFQMKYFFSIPNNNSLKYLLILPSTVVKYTFFCEIEVTSIC